jgi:Cupin-like domain
MILYEVPRISREAFQPSRWGGQPVVVLDNLPEWTAPRRWGPARLKAALGATEVAVREVIGPPRNVFQNLAEGGRVTFAEYFDWVLQIADDLVRLTGKPENIREIAAAVYASDIEVSYYLDTNLMQLSPSLLADMPVPGWFSRRPLDVNLWCGVMGTSSGLHADVTPNCNTQVIGEKHFYLFPPSQARRVYRVSGVTHCRFDPNFPDFGKFPLARAAAGWQCVLTPGESLYIPAGWFHQVTVKSGWALNVNFFWPRPFPQGLLLPYLWPFLLRRGWARTRRRGTCLALTHVFSRAARRARTPG